MKNIATQPRNNVVSHQCMTSTFANVRPLISVGDALHKLLVRVVAV